MARMADVALFNPSQFEAALTRVLESGQVILGPEVAAVRDELARDGAVLRQEAARGRAAESVLADDGDRQAAVGNFSDARGELVKGKQDGAGNVRRRVLALGAYVEEAERLAHREFFVEGVGPDGLEAVPRMQRLTPPQPVA